MNFLIPIWSMYDGSEIITILKQKGHKVILQEEPPRNIYYDPVFYKKIMKKINEENIDFVFSVQFFPILSDFCEKKRLHYICWCLPGNNTNSLFTKSVFNECNYIFHADSYIVNKLRKVGVSKIYFLPWASKPGVEIEKMEQSIDIFFIMETDMEKEIQYMKFYRNLQPHTRGFVDGLLDAQERIYGFNFIENVLNEFVLQEFQKSYSLLEARKSFISLEERYAYEVLYPGVSKQENIHVRESIDQSFNNMVTEYIDLGELKEKKFFSVEDALARKCSKSKVNFLLVPRNIQNGIPKAAMDIMGMGGFLFTNYQNDYLEFFEPGIDYVYYESYQDMIEKLRYYLENSTEREEIAEHARNRIQKDSGRTRIMSRVRPKDSRSAWQRA